MDSGRPEETPTGTVGSTSGKKPGLMDQLKAAPTWMKISLGVGMALAALAGGVLDEVASRAKAAEIQAANEAAGAGSPVVSTEAGGIDDSAYKLRTGDCFRSSEARQGGGFDEVEFVDCNGSWDFVVLNSFVLADSDAMPTADAMTEEATARCDRNYSVYIHPTPSGWSDGSRVVDCVMSQAEFTPPALGQCFQLDEAGSLIDVDCDVPHDFEAIHIASYPDRDAYPGDDEIFRFPDEACFAALAARTGAGYQGPKLSIIWITPSAATWSVLNDRVVTCYLFEK